jgi:hypothetical protein
VFLLTRALGGIRSEVPGDAVGVMGLVGDGRLEQVGTEGTVLAVFEIGGATCPWRLTRSCGRY